MQEAMERWRGSSLQTVILRQGMTITRPSGRRAFSVFFRVLPVTGTDTDSLMICICDPLGRSAVDLALAAKVFGLSHSEAKLLIALIETGGLQAAADHCKITEGSARQHLKRVFHKTHTSGQVELVALFLRSIPL